MRDPELWSRLRAHSFDPAAPAASFSQKLQSETGWDAAFCARAIEEYRRFLYLSQVSATPVTPSQAVDTVWHLHLTHTRDYWDVLCKQVLRADLHHDPATGSGDIDRMAAQYGDTRALYVAEFDAVPPADIWPIPNRGTPDDQAPAPQRSAARGWVLMSAGTLSAAGGGALLVAGLAPEAALVALVPGVVLMIWGVMVMPTQSGGRSGVGGFVAGCGTSPAPGAKSAGSADGGGGSGGGASCGGGSSCGGGGGG